ncbi:MAG: tyrosine-type recombinase/integrase [Saprospiraceae bacterium]|nr:tyrosine-type recombinase/integrase [Saprospiraceae bacterium]
MLHVFPLHYHDQPKIGFVFSFRNDIAELIISADFIQFTKSHGCYFIDYDVTTYGRLKQLGIPITVYKDKVHVPSELLVHNNILVSSTAPDITATPDRIPSRNEQTCHHSVNITYNQQKLWIWMPYRETDISMVRALSGAYWNKHQKLWCVRGSIENLVKLQLHFVFWDETTYARIYELILIHCEPKIVEIYHSPEYKEMICVKLKGHGIDVHFIRDIANARFEPEFKRWLLPFKNDVISAIQSHYATSGTKVINRLWQKQLQYHKKDFSNQEKQSYLLAKHPGEYHDLLRQYTDAMIRRNNSWSTIYTYVPEIIKFAQYLGLQSLPIADEHSINQYLSHISGKKMAPSTIHTAINAIKYYYQKVIFRQDLKIEYISRPKKGFHLPTILSTIEVNHILQNVSNVKHIAMLFILYGCGVRLNELLSLKVDDVWWDRNQVVIRNGKGNKDRVVMLSQTLKQLLRKYFDAHMPQQWLFEGQDRKTQYSERSVQKVVSQAVKKAGITKRVGPHTLRHCFATHLLDSGVQLPYIQNLLGHKDVKTTMIYTHVTTQSLTNVISPLDGLKLSVSQP